MTHNGRTNDSDTCEIMRPENLRKLIKCLAEGKNKRCGKGSNDAHELSEDINGLDIRYEITNRKKAPVIPIDDISVNDNLGYIEIEIHLRCQLACLYRLMDLHGWTLNIYNHITLRNSGDSTEFFINPLGLLYREVTASSLVKINLEGQTLDPGSTVFGVNKAGWNLHAALHSARHNIRCIIHTHNPDIIVVGSLKYGLLPISNEAVELLDESSESLSRGIRYHDYWGIAVTKEEWPSIKEDLGDNAKILFLRNHGVAVCGVDFVETWILTKRIINACENQVRILQSKGEQALLSMPRVSYKKLDESNFENHSERAERVRVATLEFEAMMRMLDNDGYQTGYFNAHRRDEKMTPKSTVVNVASENGCGINK